MAIKLGHGMKHVHGTSFLSIIGAVEVPDIPAGVLQGRLASLDPSREYTVRRIGNAPGADDVLQVSVEGLDVTVVQRNFPVKAGDLGSAIAGAALSWPSSREAVAASHAHVVVAAAQAVSNHADAVHAAYFVTVVTEAISGMVGSAYLYWGTADLLVRPEAFREGALNMLGNNDPPMLQWVRFDLIRGPSKNGVVAGGMRSRGLSAFVGYELQFDPVALKPSEVARRAIGYAEHLLRECRLGSDRRSKDRRRGSASVSPSQMAPPAACCGCR